MRRIKIFEEFGSDGEEARDTVEDILQELEDVGFETKAKYWIGGRKSYGKTAENIEKPDIAHARSKKLDELGI